MGKFPNKKPSFSFRNFSVHNYCYPFDTRASKKSLGAALQICIPKHRGIAPKDHWGLFSILNPIQVEVAYDE
jgi:hypothetical protein